jgi:hypothetical protein
MIIMSKKVEITATPRTVTFWTGEREYNVTPCHGGDRGFKSPRGRQTASKTPVSPVESPPYNGLKSVEHKARLPYSFGISALLLRPRNTGVHRDFTFGQQLS